MGVRSDNGSSEAVGYSITVIMVIIASVWAVVSEIKYDKEHR